MLKTRKHRRTHVAVASVLTFLAMAWPSAHALTYRCALPPSQAGAPPEVRYQSQACDGGRALHNADHRTDAQRAETTKATQANTKLSRQLERERRQHEKQGSGGRAIAMDDRQPPTKPASSSTQGQTLKRERPFTARVPKATPATNKGKSD